MEDSRPRMDLKKEAPRKVGERGLEARCDSILLGAGSTRQCPGNPESES